jgi:L-fuculose-phosphate aldolase
MTEDQKRTEICAVGLKLYQQGFVAANDGNVSCRLSSGSFLITPTNVSKGDLKPENLIVISDGGFSGKIKPSSEYKMHLEIYQKRSDTNAIIHVHSPYATAFALVGKGIDEPILPEVVVTLGKIPLVPYETPSTQKFAETVAETAIHYDAMLLEKHGVVTLGENLRDAYYKLERTEHVFKILQIARHIGDIKPLSQAEVKELINVYAIPDRIKNQIN